MKHFLRIQENVRGTFTRALLFVVLSVPSFSLFAQDITISKVVVENATVCNQFDVTLEIVGNPPPQPQEVVLVIDRSGSMGDNIPGDPNDPIDYAKDAAVAFVQNLFTPANNPTGLNRVAVVSYSSSATINIGLTGSSGQASVISAINSLVASGNTNIQDGLVKADNEMTNNGTFDCATSRSIILLTDGVANRDNNGNSCSNNPTGGTSACIQNAITAGVNAQTTTVGGEVYEQSIFSIGLFGAISGSQQTTATNTINAIQNAGLFTTENAADLSGIYAQILGQLTFAAKQLPGQALVTDVVTTGFEIVSGSLVPSKGTASFSGQTINWYVEEVRDETITLTYSITAVSTSVCGVGETGTTVINYEDSNCNTASEVFTNPQICVPCPSVTASIARQGCTNSIDYTGTVNQGGCNPLSDAFSWEFYLDGTLIGTANQLTGTFTYGGTLAGAFNAVLTYNGTYGSGCTLPSVSDDATITIPTNPTASVVVDNVECNGDSTGNIDLTVTGGTPPYTFAWSNGATTEDLTNVPAGVYNVTITDTSGCNYTFINGITVTQPEPISIQITKVNATLSDLCLNGQATATASGGTPPFTYQWGASAGNQTTQTATNLPVGTHTVTVTDAHGCTLDQSVAIDCFNDCDAVISVDNVTNVLCKGDATGSATVSASSVANPGAIFTFTWNTTPQQITVGTSSTISNLTAGVYTVSVTINGTLCLPVEQSVTITEPSTVLNVTATATDENGPTTGDGTATANASGGTPPYTYLWSPGGQTTQTITGLSAGNYTVTVTDANGCTDSATVTVNPGTCLNLSVSASSTPTTCNGDVDGTASANVTGGSGNFSYAWSNGGTTQTISGLAAGSYTVTVTDNVTLCTASSTTTVNQPAVLTSGIAVNNVPCYGDSTGSLDLTVTGGTAPYTFLWSNGATSEDLSGVTAGSYSVTITDSRGCTATNSATVQQPSNPLTASVTSQTDILCGAQSSVTVTANGGTSPYVFALDGGAPQASGTFTNLAAGSHFITVTDANACFVTVDITILANCTDAKDDINNTYVNVSVSGNVLTNDTDAEGDTQTVTTTSVVSAQGVTVTIDANTGAYTYTPPTDYEGDDSFQYSIQDDGNPQATDTATVYIEILPNSGPQNEPPVANEDANTTLVDVPVSGNVLVNDYDPDNDPIVVTTTSVTTAQGVTVNIDPNTGAYTYTPPSGYVGIDTFQYTICDDGTPALCDTAIVIITVIPNTGNVTFANDDAYNTTPGTAVSGNVLDNDFDPEGDNQTVDTGVTPVSGPSNGTLSINADGTFTYTPNSGFVGNDQFVYEIVDDNFSEGAPARDQATVYITVGGIRNTTDAIDDINDTFVNVPVSGNVLTNDVDFEGDTQTVTTTSVTTTQGVIVAISPTGAYTYTPPTDYVGEDTFQYTIVDDGNPQATDTATVYIEVAKLGDPQNEPPVANADTNTTEVNTPVSGNVLVNDYDPDGDPIVVTTTTVVTAQGVTVNIDANTGAYTYIPPTGYVGIDTFQYTICDDGTPALCDTATVTITVIPNNGNITVANDDSYFAYVNEVVNGNVLDNDFDPEGDNQTVDAASPISGPSNGTVTINPDGTFAYTPNTDYIGPDEFVYSIFDDGSPVATSSATVHILIGLEGNTTEAIDDINDTFVNLPVSGNVLTNDVDAEGNTQTVTTTSVTTAQGVIVAISPTGAYTYTPPTDYVGEDTFQYTIVDDGNPQATDTATVYIEIFPLNGPDNQPPVANADTNTTEENTPVSGNVLVNDYDPDGDTITVTTTMVVTAEGVTVNIDPNTGAYTYTPPTGFTGVDTFQYTICDNGTPVLCDTATVTITVIPDNGNITVANDDSYYGYPNQIISGNVLDNDSDPEGDNQFVDTVLTPISGPSSGSLVVNADGSFTYTPNSGFVGNDQFIYEIFDDGSPVARAQATVYLTVMDPGNHILAIDDINDTFVNLPVSGSVATNDENPDGPAGTEVFTLVAGSGPSNGTLVFNPDGSYTYTPNTDYVGEDTFEYQVCDGGSPVACDTATVYIEVLPQGGPGNEPPVANADTNTTEVDTPVSGNVLVNDYDQDGDPIVVTSNTNPSNGTVTVNPDGSYTYIPNPGFEGEDTFEYTICDNGTPALCDTATVTITVVPNNGNITVANDDSYNGYPNMAITGNVLDNDSDPEGDAQTVDTASPISGPSNGTVVINPDGSFTYTPNAGFKGTDQFVYAIFDNGSPVATDQATVYLTIGDPGNDILAIDDINDTFVNLPVSGSVATNDENPDGPAGTEVFTLVAGSGPSNGTLVFNPDGSYTYTPNPDFVGEDSFEYQVCDGGNPIACDTATVTIEVVDDPVIGNDPPVANNDTNTTEVDTPVSGNVLVNDFDLDGDPIVVTSNTNPSNGTVTVNPDGSYTYIPNPGFEGEDTFEYTICDNGTPALCDTATVTITVVPNNGNITVANDDAYYGEIDTPITGNVLDNDSDPEGDNQTVNTALTPVIGPSNGTLVINADGSFTYTPNAGFTGTDQFVYVINDDGSPVASN
ncbi:MAG TPA: Ig-like domain-containing protein, partial [Flavobacteriaceae bacterium]|nr:Ig-like domain-containing protein [Flavobacteriaceae bacterium]